MAAKKKTVEETLKERGSTHGEFSDHAKIAQGLKRVAYSGVRATDLTDIQREAIDMILHKVARIVSGNPHHKDHWHDIAGYSKLVEDRIE